MTVLIISFELAGIPDAEFRQQMAAIAPVFTQVPGLVSKIWLADPATNTYGGVYLFADASSCESYLESDILRAMKGNSGYANIAMRRFETIEEATRITGGPLAATLARSRS